MKPIKDSGGAQWNVLVLRWTINRESHQLWFKWVWSVLIRGNAIKLYLRCKVIGGRITSLSVPCKAHCHKIAKFNVKKTPAECRIENNTLSQRFRYVTK